MYRIKNTANDRTKAHLHRTATRFESEPSLGGARIRLGSHIDISDDHYDRVKPIIDEWVTKGMVHVFKLDALPVGEDGGPTFEEWTQAGYSPDKYPPAGYAEIPSVGLTAYRTKQEKIKQELEEAEAAKAAAQLPELPVAPPAPPVEEPSAPAPIPTPDPAPAVEPEPAPPVVAAPPPSAPSKPDQNKNKKLR